MIEMNAAVIVCDILQLYQSDSRNLLLFHFKQIIEKYGQGGTLGLSTYAVLAAIGKFGRYVK